MVRLLFVAHGAGHFEGTFDDIMRLALTQVVRLLPVRSASSPRR
jgi:hypothetical protein